MQPSTGRALGEIYVRLTVKKPDCRYPLPRNVENIRYELHVQPYFPADGIKVDPDKKFTFDGFVRIHFRVNSFAQNVSLDHLNLTFHSVALYRNNAAIDLETAYDSKTARLVVLPGEHFLPTFNYTIEVSYTGLINEANEGVAYGTYTNAKGGTSFMIQTQFAPRDARRLLPCFDDPHFKAVFELTLTYPKGYMALSNTRPHKTLANNGSFVSTTFHRTPRMSTYLLAFVIGKLASAADFTSGKEVRVWGWEEMGGSLQFAANISGKCVSAMQNYTGIPYTLDKLDILAINGPNAAMENWGLIIAGYGIVYSDPKMTPVGRQMGIARVLCHEIVHQWFGDLVTADVWGDLFLHESFARFFDSYLFMDFEASGQQQFGSGTLSRDIEVGLDQAESLLHPLVWTMDDFGYVYEAGASVLSTVESVFGKDAFRDALRSYLRAHEFGNARYRDLVAAFQKQYAQVDLGHCEGVVDLTAFLDSWFLQPDVPLIDVARLPYGGGFSVTQHPLTNRSLLPSGYEYSWTVPLLDVESGEPLWILPGDKHCRQGNRTEKPVVPIRDRFSPFARIRYDNASFETVITNLFRDAKHHDDDSVFYRLIEDELYFVTNNRSYDPTRAIRIAIERLKLAGRDGRIGSNMFGTAMDLLNDRLGVMSVLADRWEEAIRTLLTPIYSAIGWKHLDRNNWDKRALQESLLLWAVSYEIGDALTKAQGFAQEFVAECAGSKNFSACTALNVDILPAALCGGLKSKNASVVKLVDAYEAFLTVGAVQKYIGNEGIVGKARGCAQRREKNFAKIDNRVLLQPPLKQTQGKARNPTEALLSTIHAHTWRNAMEEVASGF